MAGGTWTAQNKVRPGVYIRFGSGAANDANAASTGVVAIAKYLSWGAPSTMVTIEAGEDTTPYCGYPIDNANARFLREMFKGSNRTGAPAKVLLYRLPTAGGAAATVTTGNLTATAKYVGTRGNDISIVITALVDIPGSFSVDTVIDGVIVDSQTGATVANLENNDWVKFSGTGALAATSGATLTGGVNGTGTDATAYAAFLTALEAYKFNVVVYDGSTAAVITAMQSFVTRMCEEVGMYCQFVGAGLTTPDSRYVINVGNGVKLADGTTLTAADATWWVGGATAGAGYNESLTYAQYPGALEAAAMTNDQIIAAINAGKFVFSGDNGAVRVEQDINSLTTFTDDIGKVYRKNKIMRLCNYFANSVYDTFTNSYIGVINNNETGRDLFKAYIVGLLMNMQAAGALQNVDSNDVVVTAGEDIDAVVVDVAMSVVDAVEKVYMTVLVS